MRRVLGRLIARGNTSDVYEWADDAVVKVLRPGMPSHWAAIEARVTREARRAGLPAPVVHDVVRINGRPAVVMERIGGETLGERLETHPGESDQWVEVLFELQQQVNQAGGGALPSLRQRLRGNLSRAAVLATPDRRRLLRLLDELPDTPLTCHFDFHPSNVILGDSGPVIIDWFDGASGDPAADLVRTSMLLRYGAADIHGSEASSVMGRIHRGYLARIPRHPGVDVDSLAVWEPVVMGARLAEPISDGLRRVTHRDLMLALAGESPLLASLRECRVAA